MAVVVTGAAGFIGRHLVRLLTARGERVVGIDRRPIPAGARVVPLVADLAGASDSAVEAALREADAVFHLAGRAGVRGDGEPPDVLDRLRWRDNVLAAERVLACVGADVPLVVTSSSSVYGGARRLALRAGRRPSRETDPLRPAGGYARSKLAMEGRCAERIARGGLVTLVRPFTVAGEGQRPDMAIARWLEAVRLGEPVRVLGSPDRRRRDVTDVADVADGLVRAAERGVCGPVNLGTGVGHTLRALIAAVGAALGAEPRTVVLPAPPEEPPATLAHTATCRRRLGFVPRTDLHALVRRQAAAAGLLPAPTPPAATPPAPTSPAHAALLP